MRKKVDPSKKLVYIIKNYKNQHIIIKLNKMKIRKYYFNPNNLKARKSDQMVKKNFRY